MDKTDIKKEYIKWSFDKAWYRLWHNRLTRDADKYADWVRNNRSVCKICYNITIKPNRYQKHACSLDCSKKLLNSRHFTGQRLRLIGVSKNEIKELREYVDKYSTQ